MNLDAVVKRGCPPWLPSDDAHDLDVWHFYHVPTTGTFRHGDKGTLLFTAIGDVTGGVTVWGYVPLTADEARVLADAAYDTAEEMQDAVSALFAHRDGVYATARRFALEAWTRCKADSLYDGATQILDHVLEHLNERDRLRMLTAQVDQAEELSHA